MSLLRLDGDNSRQEKTQSWSDEHLHSFVKASCLLVMVLSLGTSGFALVEGWGFHDSFYMTVITLSTVGYGEVQPLSQAGQSFAIVLILLGMITVAYAVSIIGRTALEGELYQFRRIKKMTKEIKRFENHFIICGFGRLARYVIPDLLDRNEQVVIIENDPDAIAMIDAMRLPYIQGNAYNDDILEMAGIRRATSLLAVLPEDADNVFITLSARNLNKRLKIIARTELPAGEEKLRLAGANHVVAPYRVSGARIVQQLTHPFVNDFLEIATDSKGQSLAVEQIIVPEKSSIAGKTILEAAIRQKTGTSIAAIIGTDGEIHLSPGGDDILHGGTSIIAFGTPEGFQKLNDLIE